MKFFVIFLLTASLVSPAKENYDLAFVPKPDSCSTCIEPFLAPTFEVDVVKGTWPEKPGVMRCRTARGSDEQRHLFCEGGMELAIHAIKFTK